MRHRKKGRQLGRNTKHRKALFRNLLTALFEHERIETTEAKAKELRGLTDKAITLGKEGTLHARRRAGAFPETLGPHGLDDGYLIRRIVPSTAVVPEETVIEPVI